MSELVVHHLGGAWGLPTVSPFCLKLDAWLRIAGIEHRSVIDAAPFGAPKGKAPWIEHEGQRIGDSGFIIDYLKTRFGVDPDAALTPAQRGTSLALRRLIEENLYWVLVHDRWVVDRNWAGFQGVVLGGIPMPLRLVIAPIARRGVKKQLHGPGIGLHSTAEIHAIGQRDVAALADVLGDKPFFMGDEASEIDAVAYGLLANILDAPIETPVKDFIASRANLPAFIGRFRALSYA